MCRSPDHCFRELSLVGRLCLAYVDTRSHEASVGSNFGRAADALALHDRVLDLVGSGAVKPVVASTCRSTELPVASRPMEQRAPPSASSSCV